MRQFDHLPKGAKYELFDDVRYTNHCIIYVMHKVLDFDIFIFTIIIVLAAFASRFILGFSPSSFVSGARTFIDMYMLLLIADIVMLFKIKPQLSVKGGK